jgi:hypothetical protein
MPTVDRKQPAPLPAPRAVEKTVVAEQHARLEGTFTADLVHDVLIKASAGVTDSQTTVTMGAPELLGSKVTKDEHGHLIVEDQVTVQLVLTTRRELTTMVDLLDRAHVENGQLVMNPVEHSVTTRTQEAAP